jgi:multiple sugar transport system permease protein
MLIPFPVLMVPQFMLYARLGWIGTYLPLVAPFWFGNAFSIFLLLPVLPLSCLAELEEAAQLDGCSTWTVVHAHRDRRAAALHVHVERLPGAAGVPRDRDMFTVALGLHFYQSRAGQTPWTLLMAASVLAMLPVMFMFVLASGVFARGTSVLDSDPAGEDPRADSF